MLLVSGVDKCFSLLEMKPRQHSRPPPYTVETGRSTAAATAQPAMKRRCAGVKRSLRARHEAMTILRISAAATKPGKMRNSVE